MASPNPDYPQEVKTVTGENNINITSGNFLDGTTWTNDKYINGSNEIADATSWRYSDYVDISEGNFFYQNGVTGNLPKTILYDTNKNPIQVLPVNNTLYDLSIYNAKYIRISTTIGVTPQLYQSQSYVINLGTNYFDKSNITSFVNGSIMNDAIVSTALSANYAGVSANIGNTNLNAGSYYLSCKVKVVSGTSSTTLNTIALTGSPSITVTWNDRPNLSKEYKTYSVSFTLTQNTSITNILFQLSTGNSNAILNVKDIMISKNLTGYVPYFKPIELCKIGDYQDYIFNKSGKWYKHQEIDKLILNGSQNISQAGSGTRRFNANYTTLGLTNVKEGTNTEETTATLRKCDHFLPPEGKSTWGRYYMYSNWLVFFDTESVIADATALASWFTNNNTIIYYVLATPTEVEITEPTLIDQLNTLLYQGQSYFDITNITTITDNVQPTLEVKALEKIS